jgi:hypothetical protein
MKSKKVLMILLSLAIMVSFMPTFAFADSVNASPANHNDYDAWSYDASLSTAPSCGSYGVEAYKCDGVTLKDANGDVVTDANGDELVLECKAVKNYLVGPAHEFVQDRLFKDDYLKAYSATHAMSENAVKAFYEEHANDCYVYIGKCTGCGAYDFASVKASDWQGHVAPQGTAACAESFECETCKQTIKTVNPAQHTMLNAELVGYTCGDGVPEVDGEGKTIIHGYPVYVSKCKYCDYSEKSVGAYVGTEANAQHKLPQPAYTAAAFDALSDVQKQEVQKYCVQYGEDWYNPNGVNPNYKNEGPTCTEESNAHYGILVCEDCGQRLYNGTTPIANYTSCTEKKLGHDPSTLTIAASCFNNAATYEVCKRCGGVVKATVTPKTQLEHSYKVSVVRDPSIYDSGITVVECEKCHTIATNRTLTQYPWEGEVYEVEGQTTADGCVVNSKYEYHPEYTQNNGWKPVGDWYFIGFNREFLKQATDWAETEDATVPPITSKAIKIADWHRLVPHYGAYEDMAPATCYTPLLQAKKDSVSGDWDVHSVKVIGKALGHETTPYTVDPTCGSIGFSYDTCSRCKQIVKNTSAKDATKVFFPETYDFEWVYNVVDPVVSEGTPCKFEWKVIEEATADKDGVKALVCTVCNTVQKGSETVIPADKDAKKDQAIAAATPTIEAAAAITGDASKYTADSVKAVEEAKTNLNTAMATGTAADVTRMAAELQKAVDNAQLKAANTMTASGKTITAKKNKTKTFKKSKAFSVKSAKGKVTFAKKSGKAKIVVSKSGKVTVKKGLKKGTYKVKVAVTAAGNGNYLPKTKVVTLKVKVK